MNETILPDEAPDVPWPTSDHRVRVPDPSISPGSLTATPAEGDMLNPAAQGAHDTVDRLADRAAPASQEPAERVSAAGDAVHAKTDPLRDTRDEWVQSVRTTVRGNPLASVASAVALGVLIGRITP